MTLVFRVHIQFSHSVVSDSLGPHGLQHARPSCLSPTPRVHPNPCPLSQWCHPTILSSVVPFSSCPQSFPDSGSFQVSQLFVSGGQRIGVSAPWPRIKFAPTAVEAQSHNHWTSREVPVCFSLRETWSCLTLAEKLATVSTAQEKAMTCPPCTSCASY